MQLHHIMVHHHASQHMMHTGASSCSYILAPACMWLVHPGAWIHHIIQFSISMVCVSPFTTSTIALRSSGPDRSTSMYNHDVKIMQWHLIPHHTVPCYCLLLLACLGDATVIWLTMPLWVLSSRSVTSIIYIHRYLCNMDRFGLFISYYRGDQGLDQAMAHGPDGPGLARALKIFEKNENLEISKK